MSTIDKSTLLVKLQEILDREYANGSSEVVDVLTTVLSTKALNEKNIIVVETSNDLPDLRNHQSVTGRTSGMVYFIRDSGVFAINTRIKWLTFDSRLIRRDVYDGTLWSWGYNLAVNLGDGTTISRSSPVSVIGGITDWCQVSVGGYHSLALRSNGTLWSWGGNFFGNLGDGTTINSSSPVSVVGGFTDWCQISGGGSHSLALRSNGTLWSWGAGGFGRLGTGTTITRSSPVSVIGGFTDWCQVSAGREHSVALRSNGTLWSWGRGSFGRLGDGTTINRSSPVSVVGGFTDWCQVSGGGGSGGFHNLALRCNGTLWSWGFGSAGQLGDGTTIDRSSPVSVVGGFTDWCQVSGGRNHSLALRSNGTLWSWGRGSNGQLGDGTTISKSSPVSVVGGITDWCQVSAGDYLTLALRSNGTIWGWGCNSYGSLGDGTTISKSSPVSVVGGFTDWSQVSANGGQSSAIRVAT
jgi:alpha-tubulin suppressor-like RCC1 family protein